MHAFFPDICRVVCLRILAIIRLFRLCIAGNGFRHFLLHLIPSSHFRRESETQVTSDLPSPCTAFSQSLSVNSFRWRIRGERAGNGLTFSLGPRDQKRFGREEKWGLGTRQTSDEAQASIGQSEKCLYRTGNSEREDKATSSSQWENRILHILPAHGLAMEPVVF